MNRYTIGIDLGGTTITAGLVNGEGEIVSRKTCATALPRPAAEVEQTMAELCFDVLAQAGVEKSCLAGVGIGTPGSVDSAIGTVGFNPNFGYENWTLAPNMEKLLGCPVKIENDANAAAYGELCKGAAQGKKNVVVITLGTGVGGGIIVDGKIISGCNGAGAEVGHTVIVKGGELCTCGRRGCWERYASASALVRSAQKAMEEDKTSLLWKFAEGPEAMNAKAVFDAMAEGDALAKQLFDEWIDYVSCGIINYINIFQPEMLCIGGGVSKQGEILLAPIRKALEEEDFARNLKVRTQVEACVLFNDAGLIGAAYLART